MRDFLVGRWSRRWLGGPCGGPRTGLTGTVTAMSGLRASLSHVAGATVIAISVLAVVVAGCLPSPRAASENAASSAGSGVPSARPSATLKAHLAAIAAFADRVTSGKLTYRVTFKGSVRASADNLPIAGTMDVAGADFSSSFTYDFSRDYETLGKERVQVRGVKGKGYIKRGSKAWQAIKGFGVAHSYVPFKTVDAVEDVKYLGAVKVGGATFHKVGITGALLLHPNTIPYRIQKEKIDLTELEVVIDDAGRPKSATWRLWGQARIGPGNGQLQRVVYELNLTFSKVGAKITVKRP